MRDINYRARRADNNELVYGYYIVAAGMPFISAFGVREPILVIPETVAQYTEVKDSKGEKIYEKDKMSFNSFGNRYEGVVEYVSGSYKLICRNQSIKPLFLDEAITLYNATVITNLHGIL